MAPTTSAAMNAADQKYCIRSRLRGDALGPAVPGQIRERTAADQHRNQAEQSGEEDPPYRARPCHVRPSSRPDDARSGSIAPDERLHRVPTRVRLLPGRPFHPAGDPARSTTSIVGRPPTGAAMPVPTRSPGCWSRLGTGVPARGRSCADRDDDGGTAVCGLMGFVSGTGQRRHGWTRSPPGCACARHRGPDEAGTWHDDDVVFGFNRLSIIDIEHSHQPLRWGPPESPGPVRAGVQRRDLQLPGAARASWPTEFGAQFHTEGDGEAIVAGVPLLGRRTRSPGCAGCSRS